MQISQLNLKPQSVFRFEHPRICLDIEFDLDEVSTQSLINEVQQDCSINSEAKAFQEAIENAVCLAACKIPQKELQDSELAPYIRLQIDPSSKYVFGFQITKGEGNKLIVKKVQVKVKTNELKLAAKLNSTPVKIVFGGNNKPVFVTFYLDENTFKHLSEVELDLNNYEEADDLRLSIIRAIAKWVFENYNTTITETEEAVRCIEIAQDPITKKRFGFVLDVIDREIVEVIQIKVPKTKH